MILDWDFYFHWLIHKRVGALTLKGDLSVNLKRCHYELILRIPYCEIMKYLYQVNIRRPGNKHI